MEQFGYLITDVCSASDYLYVHNELFQNITDCIKCVLLRNRVEDTQRVLYFKILKNSEIVKIIHENCELYKAYGYCHLKRSKPIEKFIVLTTNKQLFTNMLDCIHKAKIIEDCGDDPDSLNLQVKIGYFKLLNDNEIVHYLHCI